MKIDRFWLRVYVVAWILIATFLAFNWWLQGHGLDELFGLFALCSAWGGLVTLYLVGIPLRIALNLIFKERRRQRLWETVMCAIAFLTMSTIAYLVIRVYPPSSMGY